MLLCFPSTRLETFLFLFVIPSSSTFPPFLFFMLLYTCESSLQTFALYCNVCLRMPPYWLLARVERVPYINSIVMSQILAWLRSVTGVLQSNVFFAKIVTFGTTHFLWVCNGCYKAHTSEILHDKSRNEAYVLFKN